MTELSPAARATYDAFNRVGLYNEPSFETDRKALAAALRAAVDQILPVCSTQSDRGMQRMMIRNDLLVIAEELEAQ